MMLYTNNHWLRRFSVEIVINNTSFYTCGSINAHRIYVTDIKYDPGACLALRGGVVPLRGVYGDRF